jgi:hypothetical protein
VAVDNANNDTMLGMKMEQCDRCNEAIRDSDICWTDDGIPLCFDCFFEPASLGEILNDPLDKEF